MGTFIVGLIVLGLVIAAIRSIRKNKSANCGGGCASCSHHCGDKR